ncbi:hypothetical protein RFI_02343 [Reticulomyxa filosa]|uniref:Uncharacterized protein n=1 Tax=Reticulomyxa filosa TaxID=46433 RepID=X6P872_RETFI|nr:hypothetical protein RFI_02343 [Reticulomyxa filosa]|eukprot:ETO34745.1 hypothetical protein RFI_02343 [Reticulomyxa filosa]
MSSANLSSIMLCFICLFKNLFFVIIHNQYLIQAIIIFMFDTFFSSSELLKIFRGHRKSVNSIDYSAFDGCQFIYSSSYDNTICVWDVKTSKKIQTIDEHFNILYCVKFSQYHYNNHNRNVICFSLFDKTIRFWDIKDNKQFQVFNRHKGWVSGIEFSPFNGGQYLCSGSADKTIRLWNIETYKSYVFKGHKDSVWCVDFSPLQSNRRNGIGLIGGNGYTICSGSFDNTIRIWDIETNKQLIVFEGHKDGIRSVKYCSTELGIYGGENTILSGSDDNSVRLWDTRSGRQIELFNGHISSVNDVEYSPLVVSNIEIGGNSNVICSGSWDNTIRFWDIRSNKELHVIKGDERDNGILCLKFAQLRKNENINSTYLCYGAVKGNICIWGEQLS